jgi:hypothetical protein
MNLAFLALALLVLCLMAAAPQRTSSGRLEKLLFGSSSWVCIMLWCVCLALHQCLSAAGLGMGF